MFSPQLRQVVVRKESSSGLGVEERVEVKSVVIFSNDWAASIINFMI
jgi:hypothetical protein